MEPLLLQISDLTAQDEQWRKEILTHCDPYVTRAANIGPLQYLYPVLKPQFNIGAGNAKEMKKSGTQMIRMMQAYNVLGFEVNEMVVDAFVQACNPSNSTYKMADMAEMMKQGKMPAGMAAMAQKGGMK